MEVSEGHHNEEGIDNESYELMNVDMENRIFRDAACHLGRHLNTKLESLHCRNRGKQRHTMAMLQVSN